MPVAREARPRYAIPTIQRMYGTELGHGRKRRRASVDQPARSGSRAALPADRRAARTGRRERTAPAGRPVTATAPACRASRGRSHHGDARLRRGSRTRADRCGDGARLLHLGAAGAGRAGARPQHDDPAGAERPAAGRADAARHHRDPGAQRCRPVDELSWRGRLAGRTGSRNRVARASAGRGSTAAYRNGTGRPDGAQRPAFAVGATGRRHPDGAAGLSRPDRRGATAWARNGSGRC
jgi:hypothetical protein